MTADEKARAEAEHILKERAVQDRDTAAADDEWGKELALALADVRAARGESTGAKVRPPIFHGCDAVDLLKREFTQEPWLVDGLITRGGIVTIGGEPKTAKTWLGTEIAVAVATGTSVCNEFRTEPGTVAYFYAEDQAVQVRNRIRGLLAGGQ